MFLGSIVWEMQRVCDMFVTGREQVQNALGRARGGGTEPGVKIISSMLEFSSFVRTISLYSYVRTISLYSRGLILWLSIGIF